MTKRDDGGPAFPLASNWEGTQSGMSLRDYFAAKALAGQCANHTFWDRMVDSHGATIYEVLASDAYAIADAMLAERAK